MRIDLDNAKQEFTRLMTEDFGSQRMMDFVVHIWENADLTPDDAGWVLWNICDQYALGRANDPITQHKYQREFFELVKRNFPERAHWVVTDATQGVSLLRGGFLGFWCECYQFANDTVPRVEENRPIRILSHETSAFSFGYVGEHRHMRSALDGMACLLEEDPKWIGQQYGIVIHKKLLFEYYAATEEMDKAGRTAQDIERMLDDWLQQVGDVADVPREDKLLLGSWEAFIQNSSPKPQFFTAVLRTAVAFAKHGQFPTAERLFRFWLDQKGNKLNAYTEALFLLACWRNGYSKEEIRRMFNESKTNSSAGYAIHIAPELVDVIG